MYKMYVTHWRCKMAIIQIYLKKSFTRGRYEKQENVRLSILRIGVKYT